MSRSTSGPRVRTPIPGRAFSLVEIVVATGILVVVLLSLMSLLLGSQRLQRVSAERTQAEAVIEARLADLRAQLREEPNDYVGQQFNELIATIGTVNSSTGIVGPSATTVSIVLGKNQAGVDLTTTGTLTLTAYTKEDLAVTETGYSNIDLDEDGATTAAIAPQNDGDLAKMHYLPLKAELQWVSGEQGETRTITTTTLLY